MIEVEVKARVHDLSKVRTQISAMGGLLQKEQREIDSIYGYGNDFPPRDGGVIGRIRQVGDTKPLLEIKEIDRVAGGFEIPYHVENMVIAKNILTKLQMQSFFTIEKDRQIYTLSDATICLDQVQGLGDFIEVEILVNDEAEKITAKEKCLSILSQIDSAAEPITEKYGDLLWAQRNR